MAPKKAPGPDKSKTTAKAKAVDDKTFGLKNKNKSNKVQQYVNQLKNQAVSGSNPKAQRVAAQQGLVNAKDKKKAEEERQKELNALFAVAIKQPKVPPGVDPKSILCEFYRHGQCTKGFKCKFSHDKSVESKGAKIDLFTDQRDVKGEGEDGEDGEGKGMEDWDQETLERVVNEKHANEKPTNTTNIICKFFLEAVEKKQYGWFWKCPNGGDCKYRHALPAGYVLKSQMKELLEEEARTTLDVAEQIEEERAKIEARTPITEEVFRVWRSKKVDDRRKKRAAEEEERRRKGVMTGREIFMQEGFTAEDDAAAGGADDYRREGADEEEAAIREMLDAARQAADRARQRLQEEGPSLPKRAADDDEEEEQEEEVAAEKDQQGAAPATHLNLDEEDEELFDDDDDEDMDDEDLDELAEDLQKAKVGEDGAGPSDS